MPLCKHPHLPEGQWAEIANPMNGWEPVTEADLEAAAERAADAAKAFEAERAAALEAVAAEREPAPKKPTKKSAAAAPAQKE